MIEVTRLELDTRVLDKFAKSVGYSMDQAIAATAFQVEAEAKPLAPYDTGALQNSIHTEKVSSKHYIVADGVEYGIYQELGTKRMAAHPFLIPAVEKVRNFIVDKVAKIFP